MESYRPDLRSRELKQVWRQLGSAGEEAKELSAGLAPAQLWWRPGTERWSIGECLDHLVRTGEVYLKVLDGVIQEARRQHLFAEGPHRRTLVGRWLARFLEPPPGLRVRAPKRIRPRRPEKESPRARGPISPKSGRPADRTPESGSRGAAAATPESGAGASGGGPRVEARGVDPGDGREGDPLARFLALRARFGECLEEADGLDLARIKMTSPFVPLLRFDLGSAFDVIAAHERRHLWQARRVREEEGFPGD